MKTLIRFITLFFSVITLSALMAHLLELRNKIHLSAQDYLTVQGIYRGWSWLGIFEIGTIILLLTWTIQERHDKSKIVLLIIAALCLITSMVLFFLFTFPANQATANWTRLPDNWEKLRKQWEYSHAARAILNLCSFSLMLVLILLKQEK